MTEDRLEAGDGPDRVPADRFFRRGPPEESDPLVDWARDPRTHAGVFLLLGGFGVFLEQASLLFQVVIGAPVFEELLKFGAALGAATLLDLDDRALRFGVALLVGAAFGGLEHAVTYPGEPLAGLLFRVVFHAGTPAMSMAVYDAVAPVEDPRVRWAATVPATVLHWANNALSVALGLAGLAAGELVEWTALVVGHAIALTVVALAVAGLLLPEVVKVRTLSLWYRLAPKMVRGPTPGRDVLDPGPPDPDP